MKTKLKVSEMARLARINPRTLHYMTRLGYFNQTAKTRTGIGIIPLINFWISD